MTKGRKMHHLVIEEYELQVYISYRAASKKGFQNQDIYFISSVQGNGPGGHFQQTNPYSHLGAYIELIPEDQHHWIPVQRPTI